MPGYKNPNASSVVDNFNGGNIDLSAAEATQTQGFYVGSPASYGVNKEDVTISLATRIQGDLSVSANCKIRVDINDNFEDEKTYTAAVTNPEFSFVAKAGDKVLITYSSNVVEPSTDEVQLVAVRWIIKTGVAA